MSSDRHSRNTKHGAQNQGPEQQAHELAQEEEQEQELEVQEAEHSREQRQLGNQAVQARMTGSGNAAPADQGGGGGGGRAVRKDSSEQEGLAHGGEPDDDDAQPITLEDIVSSWNPSTKASKDLPSFKDFTTPTEISEPDRAWLQRVKAGVQDTESLEPTLISLLQPALHAHQIRLGPWLDTIGQFLGDDLLGTSLRVTLKARPPCLSDPNGRALHGRVHLASIAGWSVLASPFSATPPTASPALFLDFLLHLSSQGGAIHEAERLVDETNEKRLPRTTEIVKALLPSNPHNASPRAMDEATTDHLVETLRNLVTLPEPFGAVPSLAQAPDAVDDVDEDPLGLDDILATFTGATPDPAEGAYQRALESTERLAAHCITTRVAFGGLLVAGGRACGAWSAGAPTDNLMRIARHVEERTDNTLKLLVEVAQTANQRAVGVKGLRNGLRRAATQLKQLHEEVLYGTAQVLAGALPKEPEGLPEVAKGLHPIERSWSQGNLHVANEWLDQQHENHEIRLARLLVQQCAQPPSQTTAKQLQAMGVTLIRERRFGHGAVLLTMAANSYLWCGNYREAIKIAVPLRKTAATARHGMGVASATLIIMESFLGLKQSTLSTVAHHEGGSMTYRMGAHAALDRLARWRPAESD